MVVESLPQAFQIDRAETIVTGHVRDRFRSGSNRRSFPDGDGKIIRDGQDAPLCCFNLIALKIARRACSVDCVSRIKIAYSAKQIVGQIAL